MHELICPGCNHQFIEEEDYEHKDCPECKNYLYYWDHVYDEIENEVYFEGYYWYKKDS